MRNIMNFQLVPFYTERLQNQEGFTLFVDRQTQDIYKAEFKQVNELTYILIFVFVLIMMRNLSIDSIQLDSLILFISLCLFTMLMGIVVGFALNRKMYRNFKKINHQEREWKNYLIKANNIYRRQIIYIGVLLILASVCFAMLYIVPSIWWIFGGISFSVFSGGEIQFLSKTRFRLYKSESNFVKRGR